MLIMCVFKVWSLAFSCYLFYICDFFSDLKYFVLMKANFDELCVTTVVLLMNKRTRWVSLMIQLGKFVGGGVDGWLTPTTYIQLAGAGSKILPQLYVISFHLYVYDF